jgi:hypothetical protein
MCWLFHKWSAWSAPKTVKVRYASLIFNTSTNWGYEQEQKRCNKCETRTVS